MFRSIPNNKIKLRITMIDSLYLVNSLSWSEDIFQNVNDFKNNMDLLTKQVKEEYHNQLDICKWTFVNTIDKSIFGTPGAKAYSFFTNKIKTPLNLLDEINKQLKFQNEDIMRLDLKRKDFYDLVTYTKIFSGILENWESEPVRKIGKLPIAQYQKNKFILAEYIVRNNLYQELKNNI